MSKGTIETPIYELKAPVLFYAPEEATCAQHEVIHALNKLVADKVRAKGIDYIGNTMQYREALEDAAGILIAKLTLPHELCYLDYLYKITQVPGLAGLTPQECKELDDYLVSDKAYEEALGRGMFTNPSFHFKGKITDSYKAAIEYWPVSKNIRTKVLESCEQFWPRIEQFETITSRLPDRSSIARDWLFRGGRYEHELSNPSLHTPGDVACFKKHLVYALRDLLADDASQALGGIVIQLFGANDTLPTVADVAEVRSKIGDLTLIPIKTIEQAVEEWARDVQAHEGHYVQRMLKQQRTNLKRDEALAEKDKLEIERQQRMEREREGRIARAFEEAEEFSKKEQPYDIKGDDECKILKRLHNHGQQSGKNSAEARTLEGMIESARAKLDIRGNSVHELGTVLFSAANLGTAVHAFGLDTLFNGTPPPRLKATSDTASRLGMLKQSPAVEQTMTALLADEDSILLLATLTCTAPRCKKYVTDLADIRSKLEKAEKELAPLERTLSAVPDDELRAFINHDPDVAILFKKRGLRTDLLKEKTALCSTLSKEIETAYTNGKVVKHAPAAEAAATEATAKTTPTTEEIPNPAWWVKGNTPDADAPDQLKLSDMFKLSYPKKGDDNQNKKRIRITSQNYTFLSREINADVSEDTAQKAMDELLYECTICSANEESLKRLIAFGFEQSGKSLQHSAYKVENSAGDSVPLATSLEGDEIAKSKALADVEVRFHEKQSEQHALVESLRIAGVEITEEQGAVLKGSLTLSHLDRADLGAKRIAPTGYLSPDDFRTAEFFLASVMQGAPEATIPSPLEAAPSPTKGEVIKKWQPEAGKTVLFFDANAIKKLLAKRDGGKRWVDLITCTANLPNTTIIIPSVIADFELRGSIPVPVRIGVTKELEMVDARFGQDGHEFKHDVDAMRPLLEGASRARLKSDGTVDLRVGDNKNIIIMDTPGDKELYDRIRAGVPLSDIRGKDEGENAITRIVEGMHFDGPMMIVTDDEGYRKKIPLLTPASKPLGCCSTGSYVDAEIDARAMQLKTWFGEDQNIFNTIQRINEYWRQNGSSNMLYSYDRPGDGRGAQSMGALVASGWKQQQAPLQAAGTSTDQPADEIAPKKRAARKAPIKPRAITSDRVNDRDDDGHTRGS